MADVLKTLTDELAALEPRHQQLTKAFLDLQAKAEAAWAAYDASRAALAAFRADSYDRVRSELAAIQRLRTPRVTATATLTTPVPAATTEK